MKSLILFISTLFVSLVLGELALREWVFNPNNKYIRTPGWSIEVILDNKIPHVSGGHQIEIGRLGSRSSAPNFWQSPNFAVFGGSTVEDWVLEKHETWVSRLQEDLRSCAPNAWVGNFGKGGVSLRHHLLQLPAIAQYAPKFDLVIVLIGLNDFLLDYRIHHPYDIPDNWHERQAFMYNGDAEGRLASVAIIKRVYKSIFDPKKPEISDFGTYQSGLRKAYRAVTPAQKIDDLDIDSAAMKAYRDNIIRLHKMVREYGAEIVFVNQPYVWSPKMSKQALDQIYAGFIGPSYLSPKAKWYTAKALEKGLSAYNTVLAETCTAKGLNCIDLARALTTDPENFYDDFHFSEKGAATVAKIVSRHIATMQNICPRSR